MSNTIPADGQTWETAFDSGNLGLLFPYLDDADTADDRYLDAMLSSIPQLNESEFPASISNPEPLAPLIQPCDGNVPNALDLQPAAAAHHAQDAAAEDARRLSSVNQGLTPPTSTSVSPSQQSFIEGWPVTSDGSDLDYMLNRLLEDEPPADRDGEIAGKRQRAPVDRRSRCWESALCPNNSSAVSPDPATCNGGCAPFLFSKNAPSIPVPAQEDATEDLADSSSSFSSVSEHARTSSGTLKKKKASESEAHADAGNRAAGSSTQSSMPMASKLTKTKQTRRTPHNQVERRYREGLNSHLEALRLVVPSLQQQQLDEAADVEDVLAKPPKPSKAVVLSSAIEYIKTLQMKNKSLVQEIEELRKQLSLLETPASCHSCPLMDLFKGLNRRGST